MARRQAGVRFGAVVLATLMSGAILPAKASPRARETASSAPRRALPAMTLQLPRTPSWAGPAPGAPDWSRQDQALLRAVDELLDDALNAAMFAKKAYSR